MKGFMMYGPDEVRSLLDYDGCISAIRCAMTDLSGEAVPQPLRNIVEIASSKFFGLMPGMLSTSRGFGAKIISVFPDSERPGRSKHRGIVILFDRESGAITCAADASEVTEIRTAAASAVATNVLARADARSLAIFGCGLQAAAHLRALLRIRRLEHVVIWGRSLQRAEEFAVQMEHELGLPIRAVADGCDAAHGADIICTVTGAATPILFGKWVRPGTHVNIVGSGRPGPVEIDHALVVLSRYIVDSRPSALAAAAEFLLAKEAGLIDDNHIVAEIGEVLLGRIAGRTCTDEITVYKSLGHIVQDLAAVDYLHTRAQGIADGYGSQKPDHAAVDAKKPS